MQLLTTQSHYGEGIFPTFQQGADVSSSHRANAI